MSKWKKTIFVTIVFNVLVVFTDIVVLSLFNTQIKVTLTWILGSEDRTILSNLLFIEGALTIGIGALLAGGFAENRLTKILSPSARYSVEKLSKKRGRSRQEQISTGFLLMLAGLPLIIISVVSFLI